MGQQSGIPDVLRGVLGWPGQRLAVSIHCVRERGRCVSDTLHRRVIHHWEACLLLGDAHGAVQQQVLHWSVVHVACFQRYLPASFENTRGTFQWNRMGPTKVLLQPRDSVQGIVKLWGMTSCCFTIASGIGYGVTISVFSVVTYYCSLMALTLYYLLASFQSVLPWAVCLEEWGDGCFDSTSAANETANVNKSSSADWYFRWVLQ